MKINLKPKLLGIALCAIFATHGYAGSNPASLEYVDNAVQNAITQTTYTAGTAISILNNVIRGAYTAGTGITISGDTISADPVVAVGDLYQGGIVVYVDGTNQHGLVIALADQSASAAYSTTSDQLARSTGIGSGLINTAEIIAVEQAAGAAGNSSASLAARFVVQADGITTQGCTTVNAGNPYSNNANTPCFGQWYSPSLAEFQLLSNNSQVNNFALINNAITAAGGTAIVTNDVYWTSTGTINDSAQAFYMTVSAGTGDSALLSVTHHVRAMRQF